MKPPKTPLFGHPAVGFQPRGPRSVALAPFPLPLQPPPVPLPYAYSCMIHAYSCTPARKKPPETLVSGGRGQHEGRISREAAAQPNILTLETISWRSTSPPGPPASPRGGSSWTGQGARR